MNSLAKGMLDMEMIEKAAEECHHASCANVPHFRPDYRRESYPWNECSPSAKDAWRAIARVAIAAYNPDERLPELTDAMLEAGATAFCETQTLDPRQMTKVVYAAMMKAAPHNPDERLREAGERVELVDRIKQLRAERNYYGGEGDGVDALLCDIQDHFDRSALSPLPQGDDT